MLALGLSDEIRLSPTHTAVSPAEAQSLAKVVSKAQAVAPENAQNAYLRKAAEQVRFSKQFSFISGASLTVSPGTGGTSAFTPLSLGTMFSIGFDYVPNIQLASDNIRNIELHARELRLQQQQLVEATLGSIKEAKTQLESTTTAENLLLRVYQAEFRKYTMGLTDLLHVLSAETAITQASAAKVKAQLDLDILRITLHRELLSDQFAHIPGCVIRKSAEEKDKDWFGRIFHPGDYTLTIDEACQPSSQ
jgi:outer membrane protein TolC